MSEEGQAPEGQAAAPESWMDGLSEENRGVAEVKGWDSNDKAIESYRNLEKMVGADPNQILKLPTDPDSEDWNGVYSKLGRPETAADYKLEFGENADIDESFLNGAKEIFHKAGINGQQAQDIVNFWQEQVETQTKEMNDAADLQSQTDLNELKREWGNGYDKMVESGRRAAIEFGLDKETSESMETTLGTKRFMKLWAEIGNKVGEPALEGGDAPSSQTPAAAKERVNTLLADPEFLKVYQTPNVPGHADAVKKIQDLFELQNV